MELGNQQGRGERSRPNGEGQAMELENEIEFTR